jgi:hypothetical protein
MIQKYCTIRTEEQYKEVRRIETRTLRKKTRRFCEEQIKQAETLHTQEESRRYYQLVNDIRKECRPHIQAYRDSKGVTLNETPAVIMNRWKQYSQDLLGASEM